MQRGSLEKDVALRHVFLQWARGISKVEVLVDTLGLPPHSSIIAAGEACSSLPPLAIEAVAALWGKREHCEEPGNAPKKASRSRVCVWRLCVQRS